MHYAMHYAPNCSNHYSMHHAIASVTQIITQIITQIRVITQTALCNNSIAIHCAIPLRNTLLNSFLGSSRLCNGRYCTNLP